MELNKSKANTSLVYDIIGIGLGPFNLSLAALAEPISELNCAFFEAKAQFDWHPGLMMEDCTLQVPMMADLVSMADPTSRFSYLNYLHSNCRLYNFYFYEDFLIPRIDYNQYCRWVASKLAGLHFNNLVTEIEHVKKQDGQSYFSVRVQNLNNFTIQCYKAKNIVIGTGTQPHWPSNIDDAKTSERCTHSSNYLYAKENIQSKNSICIVGAGQSAGEIVLDLLNEQNQHSYEINWFTRSDGFLPMEYSKLGLEHFSPDYSDYFHALPAERRDEIRKGQDLWYKGMSSTTIAEIYDRIYRRSIGEAECRVNLQALSELKSLTENSEALTLEFYHRHQEQRFCVECDHLILATGHHYQEAACLASLEPWLERDKQDRLIISREYQVRSKLESSGDIYVQNAEIHSHGIGAPDLGLGAYRSAKIINTILRRDEYTLYKKNVFQNFGIAERWRNKQSITQAELTETTSCK